MKRRKVISLHVTTGSFNDVKAAIIDSATSRESHYVCVANVHMLVEAQRSHQFANIVNNAAFVTADGKPLSWSLRLLYGIRQERIAGMDLLPALMEDAEAKMIPVFFYGGSPAQMAASENFIMRRFPRLNIAGLFSPPFRDLTPEEETEIIQRINASGARLIFVVLGCPRQERWMARMQGKVQGVMIGVGGALPVLIGERKRAPKWMQQNGLEWLFRLHQEPRRLFKRYAVTNTIFCWLLLKTWIRYKASPNSQNAAVRN